MAALSVPPILTSFRDNAMALYRSFNGTLEFCQTKSGALTQQAISNFNHILPSQEAAKNNDSVNVPIPPVSATSTVEPQAALAEAISGKLGESVIMTMQEKDLGKAVIAIPIAIAMATMTAGQDKLTQSEMNLILVLVCLGFTAILIGVLLKEAYPKFALTVEAVGILIAATSFYVIVTFLLPVEIAWIPLVCNFLCTVAFLIAIWPAYHSKLIPCPPPSTTPGGE